MTGQLPDVGVQIPALLRNPTALDLFMFSAAAWLLHRIHYDTPFTTEREGHPGLLIHGPLQGVYLAQAAEAYLAGVGRLHSITYRHVAPAYLGEELECGGVVTRSDEEVIDLDLWVRKADGTPSTIGKARFIVP